MIADFPGIQFRYLIDIFVITMKKIEKVTGYLRCVGVYRLLFGMKIYFFIQNISGED